MIELTRKKGDSQEGSYPEAPAVDSPELSSALAELPVELPARSGAGPLKPARTDSRVALLKTYVKRLDREVLGPEEEAALDHVVSILSGALAADEDTLARRLRYLDQQFVADDASLFSRPLLEDLRRLLTALAEQATRRLQRACTQSQADNLLFNVSEYQLVETPGELPVIQLASRPDGLRSGLFPSYLPRLRGPAVAFTFFSTPREGVKLVRRVPENRLEFGFVAGPTRLWLMAFHVLRSGPGGILNIEHAEDISPAYYEARLTLPANDETYAVTQRFVLAESARFVDRLVVA